MYVILEEMIQDIVNRCKEIREWRRNIGEEVLMYLIFMFQKIINKMIDRLRFFKNQIEYEFMVLRS